LTVAGICQRGSSQRSLLSSLLLLVLVATEEVDVEYVDAFTITALHILDNRRCWGVTVAADVGTVGVDAIGDVDASDVVAAIAVDTGWIN